MIVIDAGHFYAAVILGPDGIVERAAPILRYMMGWDRERVSVYCRTKSWDCFDQQLKR